MSLASGPGPGWLLFSFGMGLVSGSKCPSQCQCLVQEVTCTGMRLTEYPPDIPLNTRRLYLNDNAIMVLPAMELGLLSDLVYLDCHDNLIGELMDYTFVGVSKLIYLDLSSNNLTSISPYGFSVLGNLVHLNISNNPHLSSLNRYTFANTSSLRYLDLRNTGLQTLDHAAFQGLLTLHTLYLSGNPWRCNCSFLDFTIYLIVTHLNHPEDAAIPSFLQMESPFQREGRDGLLFPRWGAPERVPTTLSVAAAEEETHPMPLRTGAIPGEEGRPPAAQVRLGLPTVTVAGHGQGTTSTAAVLRGSTRVMCEGEEVTRQQEQTHRA
uniref:Leucine rich repeat containing 52 n=1 Tax=Rousettus aegyptiacus TaxID=9407 RepID=A0A7J8BFL0_ROUAE|nr:leucine rich repeat containing 52 [Rousettus aegyptiacus]